MKDRIVIWGQDEKDEDILIAIRLLQDSDIIKIWTFPKKETTSEFVDQLFQEWKEGAEDNFPQPHQLIERGISEESMLPESIKTPKTDVIKIAEQEWRVRVLSFRLYQHIKQQIEQLDARASNLSIFSKDVWSEAKDVSKSIKENTLDRNIKKRQTTELRNSLDAVFDKLKKLQNAEQEKFLEISKTHLGNFRQKISEVADQIGKGNTGKKLFDQLIRYQHEVKGVDMTTRDRNALRINFNEAFEVLKANRQSNFGNRMNARVNGLKSAIEKMEASIKRDKDNVNYQSGRINKNNATQLEYQLRSAKLKLIEDRIQSKEQKLHNMLLTLKDLEKKAVKATAKAQKGVLAATTNSKKAPAKGGSVHKETEAKNEPATNNQLKDDVQAQSQAAEVKEQSTNPSSEATSTEKTVSAETEAIKEDSKEVVESNVGEAVNNADKEEAAPAIEKEPAAEAKPASEEIAETKAEEVNVVAEKVEAATSIEKEPVAEAKPISEEVLEAKAEELATDAELKKEEIIEATAKIETEQPADIKPVIDEVTESKTEESNPLSQSVSEAADNLAQKADHTVSGMAASVTAAAGGLGLATANQNQVEEPPVAEATTEVSASAALTENAAIENPVSQTEQLAHKITDSLNENQTDITKEEE